MRVEVYLHDHDSSWDEKFAHISAQLHQILRKEEEMSQATDRLTASVAALDAKVDQLIAVVGTSSDAAVTAAADALDAESAKVDAALAAAAPPVG